MIAHAVHDLSREAYDRTLAMLAWGWSQGDHRYNARTMNWLRAVSTVHVEHLTAFYGDLPHTQATPC